MLVDVLHYKLQGDVDDTLILVLLDEATRWKMMIQIADRKCETFRKALDRWTSLFGYP